MSTTTYLIIALVIAVVYALCTVYMQNKLIKRMIRDHIEDRESIVDYYASVIRGFREKAKEEESKYEIISAQYFTSESDSIKYNSEKAMERAVRRKLAMRLGNEIAKRFEPNVLPLGEGKQKYTLVVKVKKI